MASIAKAAFQVASGETDEDGRRARMEAFTLKAVENLVNLSHR